jgi:hypothetical protein
MFRRPSLRTVLLATALMALAIADAAHAQLGTTYDTDQLPTVKGKVAQYLPTPRGEVEGLLLADGTEVQLGPFASTQLVFAVKPGDTVTVHGLHARALPMVAAASVTNDATGVTVLGGPPRLREPEQVEAKGTVRIVLHNLRGDADGVLLTNGTVVRLPPPAAQKFADLLAPGRLLDARGVGYSGPLGKAVAARAIGPDAAHLAMVPRPGWALLHGAHRWGTEGAGRPPGQPEPAPPPPAQQ